MKPTSYNFLFLVGIVLTSLSSFGQVSFTADTTSGCSPLTVNFTATAPPGASSFLWDFGGGAASNQQNPGRVYSTGGTYDVTLTVFYPNQPPVVVTQTGYITVFDPPMASFTNTASPVCKGSGVTFTSTSTAGSGALSSYIWNFGDGNSGTGSNPTHNYNTNGIYSVSLQVTDANGCTDLEHKSTLIKVQGPNANFTFNNVIACNPNLRVQFTSATGQNGATHSWTFGDGGTSTAANPSHLYTTAGRFTVSHFITDNLGCTDQVTYTHLVNIGQVSATAASNKDSACLGDPIRFFCGSTNALGVSWNFANQGTSTQCNPQFVFTTPGVHTVTLTLTLFNNCVVNATKQVTILPPPAVNFGTPDTLSCDNPHTVNFTNTTVSANPTTYRWTFGDGGQVNLPNPTHTYAGPGNYNVTLYAEDRFGCKASHVKPQYIKVGHLTPSFWGDTIGGCVPRPVLFTNLSSSNNPITSYFWDFGNGTTSTLQNPPIINYNMIGTYTVKLIVTNSVGCVDSFVLKDYVRVGDSVFPSFTVSDTAICGHEHIQFNSTSTSKSGNITFTVWSFGDGNIAPATMPVHQYSDTGYFDVTLYIHDRGCFDSLRVDSLIRVFPSIAKFDGNFVGCDTPHTVQFTNTSIGADAYHWDFGTGNPADTSNAFTPTFTYTHVGSYTVTLITHNYTTGCSDTASEVVNVQLIDLMGATNITSGCAPLAVTFTGSTVNATSWLWSFGDGSVSSNFNTQHTFANPGIYSSKLIVFNNIGCRLDTTIAISAYMPLVNFSVADTSGCAPYQPMVFNNTISISPVATWAWNFGNGTTSGAQNPTPLYTTPGNHTVTLTVTDTHGCQATLTRQQYIYVSDPNANFTVAHPVNCTNNPITFNNISTSQSPLNYLWDMDDGTTSPQPGMVHSYTMNGVYQASLTIVDSINCMSTHTVPITIADADIDLLADTTFASCPPLLVQFTGVINSPHSFPTWDWDFGDGNTSGVQSPNNFYINPGSYTVTVKATSGAGCVDSATLAVPITVLGPTGSFTFQPNQGCPDLTVNFTVQDSNTTTNIADMRDGTLINGAPLLRNFSHTYTIPGTYKPVIILDDGNGCQLPITSPDSVVVHPVPIVNFGANTQQLCDSGAISFTDFSISNAPIMGWFWDFGDGSTSNAQSPTHTYSQPGNYTVKLIVTTIHGCIDSLEKVNFITSSNLPNAQIGLSDTADCVSFTLSVDDRSMPAGGPIQQYLWGFGVPGATSTLEKATYTYNQAGAYVVSLLITDSLGCQGYQDTTITVWPLPRPDFTVLPDSFGCAPANLQFISQSATAVQWQWDFGDGGSSTLEQPFHTYNQDGQYGVQLIVWDGNGCIDSLMKPQYINLSHPVADFSQDLFSGCPGLVITFTDQSMTDTTIVDWQWDFGDGGTGSGAQVQHAFNTSGIFNVTLTITDVFGCMHTIVKDAVVEIVDNIQPATPSINYVTVVSDQSILIRWRPYNDSLKDFDHYILYRQDASGTFTQVHTTTNRLATSFTDRGLNTQASSYCYKVQVVNYCNNSSELASTKAHCSMLLSPIPQQDQILVDWSPYIGWDSIAQYNIYRVVSYNMATATLVAKVPPTVTQWVDSQMFCYDAVTYRIEAIRASDGQWSRSNISKSIPLHFPPEDPLNLVRATVVDNQGILVEWTPPSVVQQDKLLLEKDAGRGYKLVYQQYADDSVTSYVDLDVEVALQPYRYRAFVQDSCGDLTPIGRDATSIFLTAERTRGLITLSWTPYETWENGVASYEIEVFDDEDARFESVAIVSGDITSYADIHTDLQQGFYCYRIRAYELGGNDTLSLSNEACVSIEPQLFTPNAFTPNNDGNNDEFIIKGVFMGDYHLQIYSRWGMKVFETRRIDEPWDGKYKGLEVPEGVYVFVARGEGFNGQPMLLRGSLTLLR